MRTNIAFWIVALVISSAGAAQDAANKTEPVSGLTGTSAPETKVLLRQLKSPSINDRMAALRELTARDTARSLLKDNRVRVALIDLLKQETSHGRDSDMGESTDFQYYSEFLSQVVRKIAIDYGSPEAWRALVYSSYGPESPLGKWIAQQPESYEPLIAWVDDKDFRNRHQSLVMLGHVCVNNVDLCPKILPILRDRIDSSDSWTRQGALTGLGVCGTAEDLPRLQNSLMCAYDWGTKLLCKQTEDKISGRLMNLKKPQK